MPLRRRHHAHRRHVRDRRLTLRGFSATFASEIGSLTELTLAGVRIHTTNAPRTWGMTQVRASTIYAAPKPALTSSNLVVDSAVDDGTVVPVVAGTYSFHWGINDGVTFSVKDGEVVDINEWDYAQREVARLEPPVRELPNACSSPYRFSWLINSNARELVGFALSRVWT